MTSQIASSTNEHTLQIGNAAIYIGIHGDENMPVTITDVIVEEGHTMYKVYPPVIGYSMRSYVSSDRIRALNQ